jgi:hypothetical protein
MHPTSRVSVFLVPTRAVAFTIFQAICLIALAAAAVNMKLIKEAESPTDEKDLCSIS